MTFLGPGSAFWGIVVGMAACQVLHGRFGARVRDAGA
jgi:predicted benzoate:H+ symporter BenE